MTIDVDMVKELKDLKNLFLYFLTRTDQINIEEQWIKHDKKTNTNIIDPYIMKL